MKYILLLLLSTVSAATIAQHKSLCDNYKSQLDQAMRTSEMNVVQYHYKKYLNCCGDDQIDRKSIENYYKQLGYGLYWNKQKTYDIYRLHTVEPPVYQGYHISYYHPVSGVAVLANDDHFQVRKGTQIYVKEAAYIRVINPHDYPIFIIEDNNAKKTLIDLNGNDVLDAIDYDQFFVNEMPNVLIMKSGLSGVYNILDKKWTIPLSKHILTELYSGFYAYQEDNTFIIIDANNNRLGSIKAQRIRPLDQGKIWHLQSDNRIGVMNIFGESIIPAIYDQIDVDYTNQILLLKKGNVNSKADMNGQYIQ